jgi:membrane protease YdiL (CAAX protease family)
MNEHRESGSAVELAAVVLTGAGHVALELFSDGLQGAAETLNRPQQYYNLAACLGWSIYIVLRAVRNPRMLAVWGIRKAGFHASLFLALGFALLAVPALTVYGAIHGRLPVPLSFWLVVGLYPLWGVAQQFGLQALITNNLRGIVAGRLPRAAVAAALFSLAHFPNWWLMGLVLPAGFVFTWIFERQRNIWAIGIVHGLLGSLAYYLVLGKDPGTEILHLISSIPRP